MKEKMKDLLVRLSNVGTIIALASVILFILNNCGILVDNDKIMNIINGLCSIGVLLGFLNNPETNGLDLPFITKNNPNTKDKIDEK